MKGFIKHPTLYNDSLAENEPEDESLPNELADFYNDYGWIQKGSNLWIRPEDEIITKVQRLQRLNHLDAKEMHSSISKTNVAKEMKTTINKGLEQKHDLKQESFREALRARKVQLLSVMVINMMDKMTGNMM